MAKDIKKLIFLMKEEEISLNIARLIVNVYKIEH